MSSAEPSAERMRRRRIRSASRLLPLPLMPRLHAHNQYRFACQSIQTRETVSSFAHESRAKHEGRRDDADRRICGKPICQDEAIGSQCVCMAMAPGVAKMVESADMDVPCASIGNCLLPGGGGDRRGQNFSREAALAAPEPVQPRLGSSAAHLP